MNRILAHDYLYLWATMLITFWYISNCHFRYKNQYSNDCFFLIQFLYSVCVYAIISISNWYGNVIFYVVIRLICFVLLYIMYVVCLHVVYKYIKGNFNYVKLLRLQITNKNENIWSACWNNRAYISSHVKVTQECFIIMF